MPSIPATPTKAANNASAVNAAEAMANPLPAAAVVLPTASSTSVFSRTSFGNSHISAMPPALSAIGPNASIASCMAVVAIIPAAAIATPYNPAHAKEPQIPPANTNIGRNVDSIPTASPPITLVACPVADCLIILFTGRFPIAV